ncbi:MAG: hypothetical protein IPI65_15565 [Bacteroidetes bacterium]|nr:hypothetical protein [Bacteroidota bacterium]
MLGQLFLDCGAAVTYDVLFTVDMNEVAAAFTTPEVNGALMAGAEVARQ